MVIFLKKLKVQNPSLNQPMRLNWVSLWQIMADKPDITANL